MLPASYTPEALCLGWGTLMGLERLDLRSDIHERHEPGQAIDLHGNDLLESDLTLIPERQLL